MSYSERTDPCGCKIVTTQERYGEDHGGGGEVHVEPCDTHDDEADAS